LPSESFSSSAQHVIVHYNLIDRFVNIFFKSPDLIGKFIATGFLALFFLIFAFLIWKFNFAHRLQIFHHLQKKEIDRFLISSLFFSVFLSIYRIWHTFFEKYAVTYIKNVLWIIYCLILIQFLIRLVNNLVENYIESNAARHQNFVRDRQRRITLARLVTYLANSVVIFLFSIIVFDNLGINLSALLATAGVFSLAIGFAAQNLIKDAINGFFILWEDQFAEGDTIKVGEQTGEVVKLNLRVTQLRNHAGALVTIPNSFINMVENLTNRYAQLDFKIGVAYGSNSEKVTQVIKDEVFKLSADFKEMILKEPEFLGVEELGESAVVYRLLIRTKPADQWKIKRALNERLLDRLQKENIALAQKTLWLKKEI
jgi:small-conductance mechanosensitive channel